MDEESPVVSRYNCIYNDYLSQLVYSSYVACLAIICIKPSFLVSRTKHSRMALLEGLCRIYDMTANGVYNDFVMLFIVKDSEMTDAAAMA